MSLPTHLTAMVLVPLVDQGTKWFLDRMLGSRMLDPGWLGAMRLVRAHTWIARLGASSSGPASLLLWASAAAPLLMASTQLPGTASSFVGLLLGGSLSHVLESWAKGTVTDCLCLAFWPAFNLADVAIAAGALGVFAHLLLAMGVVG